MFKIGDVVRVKKEFEKIFIKRHDQKYIWTNFLFRYCKEKREDAQTVSDYKTRFKRATKLINELSWYKWN